MQKSNEKIALQDRIWFKNLNFIFSTFATIASIVLIFLQIKPHFHKPVHNMEISIPDFNVNDNVFVIPMIFKNKGDFDEILTDISLAFFNDDYHVLTLSETEDVFLFQEKSNYTKIFETEIDFQNKDKFMYEYLLGNKILSLELIFNFATKENKHVTNRIKLGNIYINETLTNFEMSISIPYKKIDFSNTKEKIILGNFPRTTEYDYFKLIERK